MPSNAIVWLATLAVVTVLGILYETILNHYKFARLRNEFEKTRAEVDELRQERKALYAKVISFAERASKEKRT